MGSPSSCSFGVIGSMPPTAMSNECSRTHNHPTDELSLGQGCSLSWQRLHPSRARGVAAGVACCTVQHRSGSGKLGTEHHCQFSGNGMPHQPSSHTTLAEDENGGVLSDAVSGAHTAVLRPVDAEAFHATAGLLHDIGQAALCHLAPLTVPLGEVEKDREGRGQHRRLERGRVKLRDRTGCCRHGTPGSRRPTSFVGATGYSKAAHGTEECLAAARPRRQAPCPQALRSSDGVIDRIGGKAHASQ